MAEKNNIHVGITGGIGAGKSMVCKILGHLGYPVYNADDRAKMLMVESEELKSDISGAFGKEVYDNGVLNRKYLANVVFSDTTKLELLNSLVHPRVAIDFSSWARALSHQPIVFKEAALLFESGSYKMLDKVVVVTAPEQERISRIILRDNHRTVSDIEKIVEKQWPESQKIELADFVIQNSEKDKIIPQVFILLKKLLKQA